jgi:teichoic acid transport system ATP-binding protein
MKQLVDLINHHLLQAHAAGRHKVLIIDEALSGGDEAFKRKAQARLNEINESGATILLVSHGGAHHKNLCDRSILLDKGQFITDGPPAAVMTQYKRLAAASEAEFEHVLERIKVKNLWETEADASQPAKGGEALAGPGGEEPGENEPGFDPELKSSSVSTSTPRGAEIVSAAFCTKADKVTVNKLAQGERFQFRAVAKASEPLTNVTFEICIKSEAGEELFRTWQVEPSRAGLKVKAGAEVQGGFTIRNRLLPGDYYVDVVVRSEQDGKPRTLQRVSDMILFRVVGDPPDNLDGLIDLSK